MHLLSYQGLALILVGLMVMETETCGKATNVNLLSG